MLTTEQKQILKADVLADSSFASLPHNGDGAYAVAAAYRLQAVPDFVVWRSAVTRDEIYANGFDWVQVDNVNELKWRVWTEMFYSGACNPSKPNVRAGIAEVWRGTAAKEAVQAYVLGKCKRLANRAERLFATGTGTTASPATMGFEGELTGQDVESAMGW